MLVLALAEPTIFGIIAAACSLVGIAMAVLSHISTRKNAAEEASRNCHERLLEEERTTEKLSKELRDLRLKYGEADE
jgi:hypothetical protein